MGATYSRILFNRWRWAAGSSRIPQQPFGERKQSTDAVQRVRRISGIFQTVARIDHEFAFFTEFLARALPGFGAVEGVVEIDCAEHPLEVLVDGVAHGEVGLQVHPGVFEAHREVVGQMLSAAEAIRAGAHGAEPPHVERLGVNHALGSLFLCAVGGDSGAVAIEARGRGKQVGITAGHSGPAEPALVLRHEVAAHPAAKVRGDRFAFKGGQFVIVVALDAAVVVRGEDAAVEQQGELAVAVAGEHVAEELVVAADEEARIGLALAGVDDDVAAIPELLPAFQFVRPPARAFARGKHCFGIGQPLCRIRIYGRGQAHGDNVLFAASGGAGPRFPVPKLPAHGGHGRLGSKAALIARADPDTRRAVASGRDSGVIP